MNRNKQKQQATTRIIIALLATKPYPEGLVIDVVVIFAGTAIRSYIVFKKMSDFVWVISIGRRVKVGTVIRC